MIRILIAALGLLVFTISADARARATQFSPECNITMPCIGAPLPDYLRAVPVAPPRASVPRRVRSTERSVSTAGLVPILAAKVSEIISSCHTRVIAGVVHRNIEGTGQISLHSTGQAADLAGDPGCIYAHLRGYAGGYSIDYATAPHTPHVHVSWGGPEQGLRFRHGFGHYQKSYRKKHRR